MLSLLRVQQPLSSILGRSIVCCYRNRASVATNTKLDPTNSITTSTRSNQQRTAATTTTTTTTTSSDNMVSISSKLALAAGCYWGTEKFIVKDFQKQYPGSIKKARVGFMSPNPNAMKNPTYRQVCSGSTGHIEVLYVELTNPETTMEPLIRFFFQFHDPTTRNRQGNDAGTQYASAIFCSDEEQKQIAQRVKQDLQGLVTGGKVKYSSNQVVTEIFDMQEFYEAEESHQQYLEKNPRGCCNHAIRFKEWPQMN